MVPAVPVPVAGAKAVVAQVEASAADVAGNDTDTLKIHIKNRDGESPPSLFSLLSEPLRPLSAMLATSGAQKGDLSVILLPWWAHGEVEPADVAMLL